MLASRLRDVVRSNIVDCSCVGSRICSLDQLFTDRSNDTSLGWCLRFLGCSQPADGPGAPPLDLVGLSMYF